MQRMPCTLSFKGFIEKHGNHIQITWDLGWMLICHNFQQAKRAQVPQRQCFCSSNKLDQSLQSMMLAGMNMFGKLMATRDGMNFEPVSHRNLWQDLGTRLRRWHPTTVPTQPRISSQLTHSLSLCQWITVVDFNNPHNRVQPVELGGALWYIYIYIYNIYTTSIMIYKYIY